MTVIILSGSLTPYRGPLALLVCAHTHTRTLWMPLLFTNVATSAARQSPACAVHMCELQEILASSLSLSLTHTHQEIVSEFIHTQLAFHAKALELYTLAYQHTQAISEEEAVEVSS